MALSAVLPASYQAPSVHHAPAGAPSPLAGPAKSLDEVIPPTGHSLATSAAGYPAHLSWNAPRRPQADWAEPHGRLDISVPCCAAADPFADETMNCGCGPYRAPSGAAKHLLRARPSVVATWAQLESWGAFFLPRQRLAAMSEDWARGDPDVCQALDQPTQQGGC